MSTARTSASRAAACAGEFARKPLDIPARNISSRAVGHTISANFSATAVEANSEVDLMISASGRSIRRDQ